MTDRHKHLISLLIDLEYELRRVQLWRDTAPSALALASTEPFCVDTMDFQEWLQFVFVPRMHDLLADQGALPTQCNITAMAETVWTGTPTAKRVIAVLRALDESINAQG